MNSHNVVGMGSGSTGTTQAATDVSTKLATTAFVALARSLSLSQHQASSDYTVLTTDCFITCVTSSVTVTLTMPDATTCGGQVFMIKKLNSANSVTFNGAVGGQTFDGGTHYTLTNVNAAVWLVSDGSKWLVVTQYLT